MSVTAQTRLPEPVKKIHCGLLPLFVCLVVVCYLDRTSLAFAALQLCNEPWFNPKVYGLGSGVFYFGYVLFQIPSNLLLNRLGAKTWLPFITAAWGLVATCCILIHSPASFYVLRFFLGVAEAGAFPGMWAVCGQFYPSAYITVPYSVIEASIAVSQILAAPAAAALLQLAGVWSLAGWQWLFLAEGLATLVLAGILRWRLPSSVEAASFLTADDKQWLLQQLGAAAIHDKQVHSGSSAAMLNGYSSSSKTADDRSKRPQCDSKDIILHAGNSEAAHDTEDLLLHKASTNVVSSSALVVSTNAAAEASVSGAQLTAWQQVLATFRNRLILYLMLLKALKDIALDGLVYWVPMLVHALIDGNSISLSIPGSSTSSSVGGVTKHCGGKESQLQAVLLSAIPFGTAALAAVALGHSSEIRQERRFHIGLPLALGGCAFMMLPLLLKLASHVPAFIAVTAAVIAADATTGPFWVSDAAVSAWLILLLTDCYWHKLGVNQDVACKACMLAPSSHGLRPLYKLILHLALHAPYHYCNYLRPRSRLKP
eukprot:GHRR01035596.1.p1 GENE.GHRR01035596.1~~GHRR01035596.1.p1  ORF type:complete len:541 (+),score=194.41 GHRR01035596.1:415-2037(+)